MSGFHAADTPVVSHQGCARRGEAGCASADDGAMCVRELSETQLLARLTRYLPPSPVQIVGNGDDCAVLAAADGRYVVSTDVLVQGHHFDTRWSTAQDIGRRAVAQNLADCAAMGAWPVALVVGLVLPPTTLVPWVEELAQGVGEACSESDVGVVGGDLSSGEQIVVCVTVHGDLRGGAPILRSGARPGDVVVHAGQVGYSAAGLAVAQAGLWDCAALEKAVAGVADCPEMRGGNLREMADRCVAAFRCPRPPLAVGPALARVGASAMMDVSDSLVRDAGRLASASGVCLDLDEPAVGEGRLGQGWRDLLPIARLVSGAQASTYEVEALARSWLLTGGEDHGLLACLPPDACHRAAGMPSEVSVVGRVCAMDSGSPQVRVGGQPWEGSLGWDHFKA